MQTSTNPAYAVAGGGIPCAACKTAGVLWGAFGRWEKCVRCGGSGYVARAYDRVPFDYAFPMLAIPSNEENQQISFQLDDDAPFEQTHWVLIDNGSGTRFSVFVENLSSGWQFMNQPVNDLNFARQAKWPVPLLVPYIWHPQAEAQFTAASLVSGGAQNNAQLIMKGFKLFPPGYLAAQLAKAKGASS
jgi:hypothetical protein